MVRGRDGGGAGPHEGAAHGTAKREDVVRSYHFLFFRDRTPTESISTTSSLRIRRKKAAKSSAFRQRISSVRHGEQLAGSGGLTAGGVRALFPPLRSAADPSPHQTSAQAVAESADERPDQTEAGNHPQECHLGRYGRFLREVARIQKPALALSCFHRMSRPGGGSVQQHGGRFHETCGGGGRPAAERRSQRQRVQRTAGPHRGHHGCAPPCARAPLLLTSGAFNAHAYKCGSVQVRSCG